MTSEHWEQVAELHRAALQYEESRRAAFLDDACAGDENLRCEVESLLAYEGRTENFMEVSALELVAKQLAARQTPHMPLTSGTKLGSYEIQSPLGAGGMGEVYRATDTKLGRDVALKVLPAEMAQDPERLGRFRREAKTLAQLDHPNIVTIHSVEECDGIHFLTMQLVEGLPLNRLIPQGGQPVEQIVEIASALGDALAAAHEKGI